MSLSQCYVSFHGWTIRKESTCCCGAGWTWSYFTYVKIKKYTQRQLFHAAFALGVSLDLFFLSLSPFSLLGAVVVVDYFLFFNKWTFRFILIFNFNVTNFNSRFQILLTWWFCNDWVVTSGSFHPIFLDSWLMFIW